MAVSVNNLNKDICICDKENSSFNSAGTVKIVKTDGQLRNMYTGHGYKEFTPVDVCTHQLGHILIADHNKHRVHILDQEGQFIQYILTSKQGLYKPRTINVDMAGYVWVGEYVDINTGRIKVIRYLLSTLT